MKSNLYNIYGRNNKFVQHNIKHVGELSRSKSKKKLRKRDKLTPITPLTPADSRDDRKIT